MKIKKGKQAHRTGEEARAWAKENGLSGPYLPNDYQLILDIDTKGDMRRFRYAYDLVRDYIGIESVKKRKSANKKHGYHIMVTLRNPLGAAERIALQAIMGSDSRREAHCLIRFLAGEPNPTMFFEKGAQ
jgi:hypothetical protein